MKCHSARITYVGAKHEDLVNGLGEVFRERYFYVSINWSADIGFGELGIRHFDDGKVELETETLGKENALEILRCLVENAEVTG